jgi:hypothetical protein
MRTTLTFFFVILVTPIIFGQRNNFKLNSNHLLTIGINNTIQLNRVGIHDFGGFSKKQIALSFELGYLFSYKFNKQLNLKTGYYLFSFRKNFYKYYSTHLRTSVSSPLVPILLEINAFRNKKYFLSIGTKLAIYTISNLTTFGSSSTNFDPKIIITSEFKKGVNPFISLGIGKTISLKSKRQLEWIFSYNQGTNTLIKYTFERFDPSSYSSILTNGSNFNFAFRLYWIKDQK